jgi:hypothetical protein
MPIESFQTVCKRQWVEVMLGDMEDIQSLRQAMKGVNDVFSNQNFIEKGAEYKETQISD